VVIESCIIYKAIYNYFFLDKKFCISGIYMLIIRELYICLVSL